MKAAAEKRQARLRALAVQLRRLERRLYRVSVPLAGIRAALERPQALMSLRLIDMVISVEQTLSGSTMDLEDAARVLGDKGVGVQRFRPRSLPSGSTADAARNVRGAPA
jgi:hypothetical protein